MWIMSWRNNLIYIQTTNTNNYSSAGNSYTLDQLQQIKERVELDRTLSIISPETVNLIRKLRIQKRGNRGKRGGVKVHHAILSRKRSVNIIQCNPNCVINSDMELRKKFRTISYKYLVNQK